MSEGNSGQNTLEAGNHAGFLYEEGGNSIAVFHDLNNITAIINAELFIASNSSLAALISVSV